MNEDFKMIALGTAAIALVMAIYSAWVGYNAKITDLDMIRQSGACTSVSGSLFLLAIVFALISLRKNE